MRWAAHVPENPSWYARSRKAVITARLDIVAWHLARSASRPAVNGRKAVPGLGFVHRRAIQLEVGRTATVSRRRSATAAAATSS